MRLLAFELKKILFSRKFLYLIIGIVVAVAVLFIKNIIFSSYIDKEAYKEIENLLEVSYENSRMHNAILENNPEDEEEQERLLINNSMVNMLYEMRSKVESPDWQARLAQESIYLNRVIEYKEAGGEHLLTYRDIDHKLALNEKLIADGIPPEHATYSMALPNFMKQVVDLFVNFGAIILMILLVGEIMSSEFENRSVNLLFTQPLKRTHIITSKFMISIILYILITTVLLMATFLTGFFFGDDGTFAYPLLMESNHVIGFMTIKNYMILAITVTSVTILIIISLSLLYSLIFKNTLATLFAVLTTLALGFGITFISWTPLAWFNPFQYLLPEDTILFQNGRTWYQGIPIIITLSLVCYLLARQKIKTSTV